MSGADKLDIVRKYGNCSLAYATLDTRLEHFTPKGLEGYIAFKRGKKNLIALSEPVCPLENIKPLINGFKALGRKEGLGTAFFATAKRHIPSFRRNGYRVCKIAEDSIVNVEKFTLRGNKMQNARRGYNRAKNANLEAMEYSPKEARDMGLEEECQKISREWLRNKKKPELEFVLGRLDWNEPGDRRFFIARSKDRIEGFLTFHPIYGVGWYMDLSRYRNDAPNGTTDFLICESLMKFKTAGDKAVYLGFSPYLDFVRELKDTRFLTKWIIHISTRHFHHFYPVESQRFFKEKYNPRWDWLYLCSSNRITLSLFRDILIAFQPQGVKGYIRRERP